MFQRFIKDFKKYYKYAIYAAKSQLKAEVANSYLNWLWWVLDPICFMVIYTFIFGVVFDGSEPYFPVFIFTGLAMWDFFNRCVKASVKMVRTNKPIVSKVYLPKFVLVFSNMMVNGFKMLISFGIVFVMMLVFRVPFKIHILLAIPIILVFILFTFGCCVFLLHYGVYVEDLTNVLDIALRLVFYITGIFYNVEKRIPAPFNMYVADLNPLAYLITAMRKVLLYGQIPQMWILLGWFGFALILSILGIRKIYKNENSYVKVI